VAISWLIRVLTKGWFSHPKVLPRIGAPKVAAQRRPGYSGIGCRGQPIDSCPYAAEVAKADDTGVPCLIFDNTIIFDSILSPLASHSSAASGKGRGLVLLLAPLAIEAAIGWGGFGLFYLEPSG
jgi:hypothetical protein